jgi:hypothetical protein
MRREGRNQARSSAKESEGMDGLKLQSILLFAKDLFCILHLSSLPPRGFDPVLLLSDSDRWQKQGMTYNL